MNSGTAVAAFFCAVYGFFGILTAIGSRRRGDSPFVSGVSAALFLLAWTAWYVRDELLHKRS